MLLRHLSLSRGPPGLARLARLLQGSISLQRVSCANQTQHERTWCSREASVLEHGSTVLRAGVQAHGDMQRKAPPQLRVVLALSLIHI